ncbi:hypothetical protein [Novosphingobium sp. B1]|uniref:hypothetical protein n=1 Tax=Novosphingobium sp. B1 TaxID=1938756 RepID=UPI0009D85CDE|nr:hypothetical protein [Novosphingobium sp. B1]SMC96003.1 hypothetical protein SAMN06272759_1142 [Novosphingobium sp. B1]
MKLILPALTATVLFGPPALARATDRHETQATHAAVQKVDPGFVGHYYLSGVMETGSELLLREDGTFEWFMSYGAVDQVAKGAWAREPDAIVLRTASPSTDKPLFTFRKVEPWSEAAEDEFLRRLQEKAEEQVYARCPFLNAATDVAAAPAIAMDSPGSPPSAEALNADAAKAMNVAIAARATAEKLVVAEFDGTGDKDRAPGRLTAAEAMSVWEAARWDAVDAARKAGLPEPKFAPPALPPACTLPVPRSARDLLESQWTGGLGLRVFDMASGQGARDVRVRLHLADGNEIALVTARRGLALVAEKPSSAVVGVDLGADYAPGRDQTIAISPTASGIIHVTIDSGQINAPPFETLRLLIAGRALLFEAMGRGRYERP